MNPMDTLDHNTLIPVGVVIASTLTLLSLVWRVSSKTTEVLNRLDSIEQTIDSHWTRSDQLEWIVMLRETNPSLHIPLPLRRSAEGNGG